MPCGETFARNALYAQNYFRTRFGKICTTGYSVDSFGQNASLPMLLRQSGMTRYVYQRPGQHEKEMDSSVFLWRSDDGSQVTAARLTFGYGAGDADILRARESDGAETDAVIFFSGAAIRSIFARSR
jgi:alpha-mannosidase